MEKAQWLQLLLGDVAAFNEYRRANPKEPVDLSDSDLSKANLRGAFLADANLAQVALVGADLTKANLSSVNLQGANLQGADMTDVTLHRADLTGADVRGAKVGGLVGDGRMCLHPACFENVLYDKAQLEGALEVLNRNRAWQIKYELVPKESQ